MTMTTTAATSTPAARKTPQRRTRPAVPGLPAAPSRTVGPEAAPEPGTPGPRSLPTLLPPPAASTGLDDTAPRDAASPDHAVTVPPSWPLLDSIGLSPAALAARTGTIGGSDANVILSGSDDRVLGLWREKRGEAKPADLSHNLAVMLGSWSEAFNRQWYERDSGHAISRIGDHLACPVDPWRSCTLDGYIEVIGAVFEAKHTNAFTSNEDALARWMPQLQHNMAVTGCKTAMLSVIFGNARWEVFEIAADWLYQADLLAAEHRFWTCVQSGEPPVALPPPTPPRPIGCREVNLAGSNAWAAAAADWIAHRSAAASHKAATAALKELVEADVTRAFGHGIEARRSKAGALTIRELGE